MGGRDGGSRQVINRTPTLCATQEQQAEGGFKEHSDGSALEPRVAHGGLALRVDLPAHIPQPRLADPVLQAAGAAEANAQAETGMCFSKRQQPRLRAAAQRRRTRHTASSRACSQRKTESADKEEEEALMSVRFAPPAASVPFCSRRCTRWCRPLGSCPRGLRARTCRLQSKGGGEGPHACREEGP